MWRTLIRANRAYVRLKDFSIEPLSDGQNRIRLIRVSPVWENGGNAPTRKMSNYVSWDIFTPDLPPNFNFPDMVPDGGPTRAAKLLIGPKQTRVGQRLDITAPFIEAVRSGKQPYMSGMG
jgi:hypothetical protein